MRGSKRSFIIHLLCVTHHAGSFTYLLQLESIRQVLPSPLQRREGAETWCCGMTCSRSRAWKSQIKAPQSTGSQRPTPPPHACQHGRCDLPRHREEFKAKLKTTKMIKKGAGEQLYCGLGWISLFLKSPLSWYNGILIN